MHFFRDTSINKKILVSPAIVVVTLGIVLVLALNGLNKQQSMLKQVHDVALERIPRVNELIALSERVQSDVYRIADLHFMKLPEVKILPIHKDLEQGLSDLGFFYHRILTQWALDQEEKDMLKQMRVSMDTFKKEAQQAVIEVAENPSFGILLIHSASVPFRDLREQLRAFLSYQNKKIQHTETISERAAYRIKIITITIALLTALIALLITVLIGNRFISRPISSMTALMQRLSKGDLSLDIGDRDRGDEIGSMARAVEVFRENAIEKRAAEETLVFERAQLLSIFDSIDEIVYVTDPHTYEILYVNQNLKNAFQKDPAGGICYREFQGLEAPCDFCTNAIILKNKGKPYQWEYHNPILDQNFLITDRIIKWPDGRDVRFEVAINITDRKQAEEQIKESLKEKEILLQEIHHRVKNNMQVISSLLRLQASGIGDERVSDALMECQGRIQSMAFVHETLYGSDSLAVIDFQDYIFKVASQIFQTYRISMDRVNLAVHAKDIKLGIKQATPLGLIVTELTTNSLKYAFPENRSGEIVIRMREVEEDLIEFVFKDNGIGIPEGMDWRNADSLGLQLVITLAEDQLDGTVNLDRRKGTHFIIRFRHEENK